MGRKQGEGQIVSAIDVVMVFLFRWCEAEREKEKKMNNKQWHETFQQRCPPYNVHGFTNCQLKFKLFESQVGGDH